MKTPHLMPRAFALPAALGLGLAAAGCATDPYIQSAVPTGAERAAAADRSDPATAATIAALRRVAAATRAAGDYGSAINVLKRAHDLAPGDGAVALELGETLAAAGAHNEARDILLKAVAASPRDTRAIRGLANVLVAMSEPALAATRYREAIAIQPEAASYNGLGVALDALNEAGQAEEAYRAGLALDPASPGLIGNLALSLALAGRHPEAIELISAQLREGPSTARLRQNLALIYGLAGRTRDARAVLRIDLDERSVANNLAYYEMLRGLPAARRREAVLGVRDVVPGAETLAGMPSPAAPQSR